MSGVTTSFSVDEVFKIQRERIRTQEYESLGRLVQIGLELQLGHPPTEEEIITRGRIDLRNQGSLLAFSRDHADLLLPAGVPLELPDIADPLWIPKQEDQKVIEAPGWKPQKAPMIKQSWIERATGKFVNGDETWVIFQPVIQVVYRLFTMATYGMVKCNPQPWQGTRTALLVNPKTGEAYFYGGTFEIGVR